MAKQGKIQPVNSLQSKPSGMWEGSAHLLTHLMSLVFSFCILSLASKIWNQFLSPQDLRLVSQGCNILPPRTYSWSASSPLQALYKFSVELSKQKTHQAYGHRSLRFHHYLLHATINTWIYKRTRPFSFSPSYQSLSLSSVLLEFLIRSHPSPETQLPNQPFFSNPTCPLDHFTCLQYFFPVFPHLYAFFSIADNFLLTHTFKDKTARMVCSKKTSILDSYILYFNHKPSKLRS